MRKILCVCLCVLLAAVPIVCAASVEECEHEFQTVELPASCADPGVVYEECIRCGLQINYANTPALGHEFGAWTTLIPASCTKPGTEVRSCTRCGASEERESEPTGHDYETQIVPPQCTIRGYTLTVCRNCGDSEKGQETEPIGHDYELVEEAPTCTEKGYSQHTCRNCGKITEKREKKALGHDYEPDASGRSVCTRCGEGENSAPAETKPRETEPAPKPAQKPADPTPEPTQAPTEPVELPRRTFRFRTPGAAGWFRATGDGDVYEVDGLDPDIGPICERGRVHFLWGFGTTQRAWLRWARMEE